LRKEGRRRGGNRVRGWEEAINLLQRPEKFASAAEKGKEMERNASKFPGIYEQFP